MSRWLGVGLVGVWLLLRLALLSTGAELGEGIRVRVGEDEVAGILFRGATPAKTLLVATHGGLASKETMLAICWEARRRGADCVAIDALGHGASSDLELERDVIASMRKALRVDRTLAPSGSAIEVRFVGHSMGAFLGCGVVFPCGSSVAIGQGVRCPESRMVRGDIHRSLGLSDTFYMPISHVLEPWTPSVVDTVLDRALPLGSTADARRQIGLQVALAWLSFFAAASAGLAFANVVRASSLSSPAMRGLLGATIAWSALILGGFRNLWFLLPSQPSDALVVLPIVGTTALAASLACAVGLRAPAFGCLFGAGAAELAAVLAAAFYPPRALGGILAFPVALIAVMALFVVTAERISRQRSDVVESGLFVSTLLGMFLALLLPGGG